MNRYFNILHIMNFHSNIYIVYVLYNRILFMRQCEIGFCNVSTLFYQCLSELKYHICENAINPLAVNVAFVRNQEIYLEGISTTIYSLIFT